MSLLRTLQRQQELKYLFVLKRKGFTKLAPDGICCFVKLIESPRELIIHKLV